MRGILLLCTCITILATGQVSGATWHVAPPPLGNDSNPGTEGLPFATIQHSIDASSDGDTVIVAEGTYVENITFDGKNIVLRSTDPLDPTVVASTMIDGNQAGAVVSFSGTENETCLLCGFTIRNGNAEAGGGVCGGTWDKHTHATIQNNTITGSSATDSGGGLAFCSGTIQDNTITGNSAVSEGGGLAWCMGTIQNNTITGNSSESGGGLADCDGTVQNNTIAENSAGDNGGGLCWCYGTIQNNIIAVNSADSGGGLAWCEATIQNNTITGNTAAKEGGGLYDSDETIQNNTITENSAGDNGGGLEGCDGTIQNNMITGNTAAEEGGGLYGCHGTIQNNTIAANSASSGGGLEDCRGTIQNNKITNNSAQQGDGGGLSFCSGTIQNNTIADNSASGGGGLAWCSGTIRNCIIWGNKAPRDAQVDNFAVPTYSCVQGWTGGGEGNTDADPLFSDADGPDDDPNTWEDNNYRLQGDSPCVDAGKNEDSMWDAVDLDGNPRVTQGRSSLTVDMGAYEYGFWHFTITRVLMTDTGGFQLTWTSSPGDQYVVWSCTDLTSGAWTQEAAVPSAGDSTSWTDFSPSGSQKFCRVEQL